MSKRIEQGEKPRADGFFDSVDSSRSKAVELFEAVLLKARQEAQERKLPYLAKLLENSVFSRFSAEDFHAVLSIADRMRYRQFGLLALHTRRREFQFNPVSLTNRESQTQDPEARFALHEWYDLRERTLGVIERPQTIEGPDIRLTLIGEVCFDLLGLIDFPDDEIRELIALLQK